MGELPAFVAGGLLTLEYGVSGAAVARSWGDKVAYAAHSLGVNNTSFLNYEHASMMAGVVQVACVLLLLGGMSIGTKAINTITVTKVSGVCGVQRLQCALHVLCEIIMCGTLELYSAQGPVSIACVCAGSSCVCSRPPTYTLPHPHCSCPLHPPSCRPTPLPSPPCLSPSKVVVVMFMIVVGFTKFDPELLHPLVPPAHNFEPTAEDKANVSAVGENAKSVQRRGGSSSSIVFNHYTYYLLPTPSSYSSIPPFPPPAPLDTHGHLSPLPSHSSVSHAQRSTLRPPSPQSSITINTASNKGFTGNVLLWGWRHSRRRHPSIL